MPGADEGQETETQTPDEPEAPDDRQETAPETWPTVTDGHFSATGPAGATAEMLAHLFTGDPREVTFTLTFAYTETAR